jgi:hypothetical protein
MDEYVNLPIEDGTIKNIAEAEKYQNAFNRKFWIAVVTRDMAKPGTLDRKFLSSIDARHRGLRCHLSQRITIGSCIEMAAKVTLRRASRYPTTEQILLSVIAVLPDRLIAVPIKLSEVPRTPNGTDPTQTDSESASDLLAASRLISQLEQTLEAKNTELRFAQSELQSALAVPANMGAKLARSRNLANRLKRQFKNMTPEMRESLSEFHSDLLLLQQELKIASTDTANDDNANLV